MGLLTIGAFARASRLSPKALRLGMPLARIQVVAELGPAEAAAEVAAYWRQVEVDTEARRNLATFLIDQLSRKDTAMIDEPTTLAIRYAVRTDRGLVRESNQDSAYAGSRLLAVADGFGARGDAASAVAIEALKPLDAALPAGDLLNALQDAVQHADTAVGELGTSASGSEAVGTTLTAMLWSGSRLALVHVGDSRVYLLRGGELFQITHDHSVVQSLVDEGRLTPEEAASHPQRAILIRALNGGRGAEPDLQLQEAHAGDRYLLCSDGLYTAVRTEVLHEVMSTGPDPETTVRRLVDLANNHGGPDNIACVVADIVDLSGAGESPGQPA
jgi:PPM family protein phosphatase